MKTPTQCKPKTARNPSLEKRLKEYEKFFRENKLYLMEVYNADQGVVEASGIYITQALGRTALTPILKKFQEQGTWTCIRSKPYTINVTQESQT